MWLFYVLLFVILFLGVFMGVNSKTSKWSNVYYVITFLLFFILAAFRSVNIGNDTQAYIEIYNKFKSFSFINIFQYTGRYELGYLLLNKLVSFISLQPQTILIVTSFLILLGYYKFIQKYSLIPWLSIYLFFTLGFWGNTMNTIRKELSIVILLVAFHFIIRQKLLPFLITIMIATLFHSTAIIFIIAYPLASMKFNKKLVMMVMSGSIACFVLFPLLLKILFTIFPQYSYYIGGVYLNGNIRMASILGLLIGIMILLFGRVYSSYDKTVEFADFENERSNVIIGNEIISVFMLISIGITLISFNFNLLSRAASYFEVFSLIYIPNIISQLNSKYEKLLLKLIIVIIFFIYAYVIQVFRPEWNMIYPFEFFWQMKG